MRSTAFAFSIFIATLICSPWVHAGPVPGKVEKVIDGDTLRLADETDSKGRVHTGAVLGIRGIAAPALDQPFGKQAHERLKELIEGKAIIRNGPTARAYREGNTWFFRTEKGESLALLMISEGLAWTVEAELEDKHRKPTDVKKVVPETEAWLKAEREAREAKRGLWADKDPVRPWEWRAKVKESKKE
jgi:endonuclease YncB( thermonuclease family)